MATLATKLKSMWKHSDEMAILGESIQFHELQWRDLADTLALLVQQLQVIPC